MVEVQSSSVVFDNGRMIDAEAQDLVRRALQAGADSFGQLCKRYYQPGLANPVSGG